MKILFRFGDNDFSRTFIKVFELLEEKYQADLYTFEQYCIKQGETPPTYSKEFICRFINTLAYPIFRTLQHDQPRNESRFSSDKEEEDFYREYLKATPDRIYLEDEVSQLLDNEGFQSNGDWYVLDTKQFKHKVYSL